MNNRFVLFRKTVRFKIYKPNWGKIEALKKASLSFRKGLNYSLEMAKENKPRTSYDLHPYVYSFLSELLPAQLAADCRDKAFESYKSHQKLKGNGRWRRFPHFDKNSFPAARYNIPRSLSLKYIPSKNQYWISVKTLKKRTWLRIMGKEKLLKKVFDSSPTFAEIVFKGGDTFVHIGMTEAIKKPDVKKCRTFIGVDLNVSNQILYACARDLSGKTLGTFNVPAGRFNWKRKHFNETRKSLGKAKLLKEIKRIKDKESRFVNTLLHEKTTEFINWCKQFPNPFIALEDLTNIRQKVKYSKKLNRKIHSWPFRKGQDMIKYKGLAPGFFVKLLSGAFSSRYCSRCHKKAGRSGQLIVCPPCSYVLNAHLNGARNMSWRAIRYHLVAAGRAESQTAERKSGPELGSNDNGKNALLKRPISSNHLATSKAHTF